MAHCAATDIHWAAKEGNCSELRQLITSVHDANAPDSAHATPLHWAVSSSQAASVELLIQMGASPMARATGGATPLHGVREERSLRLLLRARADLDAMDRNLWTPLHTAIIHQLGLDVVVTMLKCGASVCAKDSGGCTPLHWACINGNLRHARAICENDDFADVQMALRTENHNGRMRPGLLNTQAYATLSGGVSLARMARAYAIFSAYAILKRVLALDGAARRDPRTTRAAPHG